MNLNKICISACCIGLFSACVPEDLGLQQTSPKAASAAVSAAPEYPIAPASRLSAIVGSWGPVNVETIIKADGSFQFFADHHRGKRRVMLAGYIAMNSSGQLFQVYQRYADMKKNYRLQTYPKPSISRITLGTEKGIPVMTIVATGGTGSIDTSKYIRTADHRRGYDVDFVLREGKNPDWFVKAPKARQTTKPSPKSTSNQVATNSNATVSGPAAGCVSLRWESHAGAQARAVHNTCSRGIVVRVCHVSRLQRGECRLQSFTNPLEHNFGQLMLTAGRPKWRTNWYQSEGAATNLRFYAKYIP